MRSQNRQDFAWETVFSKKCRFSSLFSGFTENMLLQRIVFGLFFALSAVAAALILHMLRTHDLLCLLPCENGPGAGVDYRNFVVQLFTFGRAPGIHFSQIRRTIDSTIDSGLM